MEISFFDFIDVQVKSASEKYFCKVTKPQEVSMGNWGSRIVFYKKSKEVLYYRHGYMVHCDLSQRRFLKEDDLIPRMFYVNWSENGNHVIFFEYKRSLCYEKVLLDFETFRSYRVGASNSNAFKYLSSIKDNTYNGEEVVSNLLGCGVKNESFYRENLPNFDFWDKIFGHGTWYPRCK